MRRQSDVPVRTPRTVDRLSDQGGCNETQHYIRNGKTAPAGCRACPLRMRQRYTQMFFADAPARWKAQIRGASVDLNHERPWFELHWDTSSRTARTSPKRRKRQTGPTPGNPGGHSQKSNKLVWHGSGQAQPAQPPCHGTRHIHLMHVGMRERVDAAVAHAANLPLR